MKYSERKPRRWALLRIPVGPEDNRAVEVLVCGPKEPVIDAYEAQRDKGDESGGALVVVNGWGQALYACS